MSDALARLEPRSVWSHFAEIARIPRPSKHEERIAAWVRSVAEGHGFDVRSDATGNLVVVVPASPGHESAAPVVLQSHLDMVCEKNRDVEHDFMADPIRPRIDGEWVTATGTTLGADNGIGVAAALAAATAPEVVHGPLRLLFTLDEETGLTGAQTLDSSMLDARTLLNLDSEEDGVLFVGCAGGIDAHLTLPIRRRPAPAGTKPFRLAVRGLRGGHSGLNIHEGRGNAVKLLARTLVAVREDGIDFALSRVEGGSAHNAIPREAEAQLALADSDARRVGAVLDRVRAAFATELAGVDDALSIALDAADGDEPVLEAADRDRALDLLAALPHGALAMSRDIPGLVETSTNLATVAAADANLRVVTSSRSSVDSARDAVLGSILAAGRLAGADVAPHGGYPGWKPNLASPVLGVVRAVYRDLWGRDPKVTAIHAGLECGLFAEKMPGLDMVSFGPQIEGAHSPDERVHVASVERFWHALVRSLGALARA